MKFILGGCHGATKYYNAVVEIDDVEIDVTIVLSVDENTESETIIEILVINPEDIPVGKTEKEIIKFVEENF